MSLKEPGGDEVGERLDRRELDARSDERRDRGMYLDAAQFERSGGKRTRARVNVEHIGSRAPGQVVVDASAELDRQQVPIYSFGSRAKRGDGHLANINPGLARRFVPDLGDRSVQMVRIAMKRTLAHGSDEAIKCGVVDLIGLDALPARMTRQTRKPDAASTLRKPVQQSSPTRAQGALAG